MTADRACRACDAPLADVGISDAATGLSMCDDCLGASSPGQDIRPAESRPRRWKALAVGAAGVVVAAYAWVKLTRQPEPADRTSEDEDDGDEDYLDADADYWDDYEIQDLSPSDAADIWRSRGEDEDYMFGYSWEELRRAADE